MGWRCYCLVFRFSLTCFFSLLAYFTFLLSCWFCGACRAGVALGRGSKDDLGWRARCPFCFSLPLFLFTSLFIFPLSCAHRFFCCLCTIGRSVCRGPRRKRVTADHRSMRPRTELELATELRGILGIMKGHGRQTERKDGSLGRIRGANMVMVVTEIGGCIGTQDTWICQSNLEINAQNLALCLSPPAILLAWGIGQPVQLAVLLAVGSHPSPRLSLVTQPKGEPLQCQWLAILVP